MPEQEVDDIGFAVKDSSINGSTAKYILRSKISKHLVENPTLFVVGVAKIAPIGLTGDFRPTGPVQPIDPRHAGLVLERLLH